MQAADADVYYYNCGDLALGQIVRWCRRHRRKCVYSTASNADCDVALPLLQPWRERLLYRYGLHRADRVIVQTQTQQRMLRDGFGVNALVIPLPCEDCSAQDTAAPQSCGEQAPRILWVGRISEEKRLEWLLEIAQRCPQYRFDVVGAANVEGQYSASLAARARGLANVTMHGRVPHAEMGRFYRAASVLCCTSCVEGFPNTFLEAWSQGRPVVTTFDPDGVVASQGLGWVGRSAEELTSHIRAAHASPQAWQRASVAARAYYQANHTIEAVLPRFEKVFHEVMS
jgi:glycosyltransferase involved in cell wall biosynthesis